MDLLTKTVLLSGLSYRSEKEGERAKERLFNCFVSLSRARNSQGERGITNKQIAEDVPVLFFKDTDANIGISISLLSFFKIKSKSWFQIAGDTPILLSKFQTQTWKVQKFVKLLKIKSKSWFQSC